LIEVVNKYGSFFYGSILGVFVLAMLPRAKATAAFIGLIVGITTVFSVWHWAPQVSYLWYNVVGVVAVLVVGVVLSMFGTARHPERSEGSAGVSARTADPSLRSG
jgi:Na+/proline symporter